MVTVASSARAVVFTNCTLVQSGVGIHMTTQQNNACLADFLDFMNRKGLNTTSQRRIIAEAFF